MNDVRREKLVILQCFRSFVESNFLNEGGGSADRENDAAITTADTTKEGKTSDQKGGPREEDAQHGNPLPEDKSAKMKNAADEDKIFPDYSAMLVRELQAELRKRGEDPGRDRKRKLVERLQQLDLGRSKDKG